MALSSEITSTLVVKDAATGNLVDLSTRIAKTFPVAKQKSIISQVAQSFAPNTSGLYPQKVLRDIVRKEINTIEVDKSAASKDLVTGITRFTDSIGTAISQVDLRRVMRQDSFVLNNYDNMAINQQYDVMAAKVVNWLTVQNENDLFELLKSLEVKAQANQIYKDIADVFTVTAPVKNAANDGATTKGLDTVAKVSTEIDNGNRVIWLKNGASLSVDGLFIGAVRDAISYLTTIGSPQSPENGYPFAINGLPVSDINVVTTWKRVVRLKSSLTTSFINMNDGGQVRNFNGLVGMIDTVPVMLTNQLRMDRMAVIMSNRALYRRKAGQGDDLAYVGVLKDAAVAMVNKVAKALAPSDKLLQFEEPRLMGELYPEEAFFINEAVA